MRFLQFIEGKSFLAAYAIYAAFVIILSARILKNNNGYCTISEVTIILFIALVCLCPYLRGRLKNEGAASK